MHYRRAVPACRPKGTALLRPLRMTKQAGLNLRPLIQLFSSGFPQENILVLARATNFLRAIVLGQTENEESRFSIARVRKDFRGKDRAVLDHDFSKARKVFSHNCLIERVSFVAFPAVGNISVNMPLRVAT